MISIALITLSLVLIFTGKMPLVGGKAIKGQKVRIGGLLMLALSGFSIFVATKMSLLLNSLVIIGVIGAYFFLKGDIPNRGETGKGLFTSKAEEKKTYSQALLGLLIAIAIMILFVVGIFLLLMIIREG